jgi:hypothetical protein
VEGNGITPYSEVIRAVGFVYGAAAVYRWTVVGNLFQFAYLGCPSRNSLCRGELFVLLPCFWRDGEKLVLGDGDGDVQGAVDDFADDGGVFNGGGYQSWGPEVSEAAVFLMIGKVTAGAAIVVLDSVAGPAALGLVPLATPT